MTQKLSQPQFVVLYKLLLGITNYFKLLDRKFKTQSDGDGRANTSISVLSVLMPRKVRKGFLFFISVFIIIIRPKLRSTLSLEIGFFFKVSFFMTVFTVFKLQTLPLDLALRWPGIPPCLRYTARCLLTREVPIDYKQRAWAIRVFCLNSHDFNNTLSNHRGLCIKNKHRYYFSFATY